MPFPQFSSALALIPLLSLGGPTIEIAQNQDPYSDWTYLYEDTFEGSSGEAVTQQWWLNPETSVRDNLLVFTLLARRNPVSGNGTAAAVFDYVADCAALSYSMEKVTFIDSSNATIDTQTNRTVMEAVDPSSNFYSVLQNLCN